MFVNNGLTCPVVKIEVEIRVGEENLISCIRKSLIENLGLEGSKQVGLGGIFMV